MVQDDNGDFWIESTDDRSAWRLWTRIPRMKQPRGRLTWMVGFLLAAAALIIAFLVERDVEVVVVHDPQDLVDAEVRLLTFVRCEPAAPIRAAEDQENWPICGALGERDDEARVSTLLYLELGAGESMRPEGIDVLAATFERWRAEASGSRSARIVSLDGNSHSRIESALKSRLTRTARTPTTDRQAYVDHQAIAFDYGVELFRMNGETITIASHSSGPERYVPGYFVVPTNLKEYSAADLPDINDLRAQRQFIDRMKLRPGPEPACTFSDRWALLAHEPHNVPEKEEALFDLLRGLQEDQSDAFKDMLIFQEGQPTLGAGSGGISSTPTRAFANPISKMVNESAAAWASEKYQPLNRDHVGIGDDPLGDVLAFAGLRASDPELGSSIEFYAHTHPDDSLDVLTATEDYLRGTLGAYGPEDARIRATVLNRMGSLTAGDEELARWFIRDAGYRGALVPCLSEFDRLKIGSLKLR